MNITTVSNLTILGCWILFVGYWIGAARGLKPVAEREDRSAMLAHRLPVLLGGILVWWPVAPHHQGLVPTPGTDVAQAGAAAICVAGLGLAIWARRTLAGNWSRGVTFKQGHELVKSGPYRFARHPIYTGMLLMCFGTALSKGRIYCWLGFLILSAGLWIKLRQEEALMMRHFPEEYPAYRERVKSLVPFVL
ncbi:MAG: isoprenylcysteine carboxylmethyltransferase family protein [Verrucomicrobiota bacterium]|jgi:protein-S-isoprenylcysteine O-methyltransferase Ste14